jgi:uncharacterized membrane protein YhhN
MPIFLGSLACSVIYGLFFSNRSPGVQRVVLKTAATCLLAVWAYLAGAPMLIVLALAFSTLGDAFLGASEEKFLLPGMAAFFVAHAAYVPLFWDHAAEQRQIWLIFIQIIITVGGAIFVRSLMSWIEKTMRLPVMAYTIIILLMVNAALRLDPVLWVAALGACAFAASDTILSFELFRLKPNEPVRKITSRFIWFLYFGGQAMIAWAFVQFNA